MELQNPKARPKEWSCLSGTRKKVVWKKQQLCKQFFSKLFIEKKYSIFQNKYWNKIFWQAHDEEAEKGGKEII